MANGLLLQEVQKTLEMEKILIRKITGKNLLANYIHILHTAILYCLFLSYNQMQKISYKSLLGIINSNFIGWYFRKKFQISDEDTFPQIMIRDILQFHIPK